MSIYTIFTILLISSIGIFSVNSAFAEVDSLIDIEFLQTGVLNTFENQFHISNEITIREFFNGNIIRVSGQVIEGFPYITYSKILEDEIVTHGMIFIAGKFVDLNFEEKIIQEEVISEKKDDLAIVIQYTQRVHTKNLILIDVKIFDEHQNTLNNFYQNDGTVANTDIEVLIIDEDDQVFYSSNGTTNEKGLYEIEYLIPDNSKRETLTVTINAENKNSRSTKILQIFSLGNEPSDGSSS